MPGPLQGQLNPKQDDASRSRFLSQNESGSDKDPDMLRPTDVHMSKGAGRFVKAVVQAPVDLSSGVKAVGREFGFGWYDGVTGLVTQPWKGAQKEGASGFVKGVGKGIGGFIAKPGAAVFGILGHTMQGVSKEVQKLFGGNVQNYIRASRVVQGYEEWLQSSDAEKKDVIVRWKLIQKDLKKMGNSNETVREAQEAKQKMNLEDRENHQNSRHTVRSAQSANSADAQMQDLESTTLAMDGSQSPLRATNRWERLKSDHQADQANLHQAMSTSEAEAQQHTSDSEWDSNLGLDDEDDEEFEQERKEPEKMLEEAVPVAGGSLGRQRPPSYDPGLAQDPRGYSD
ncbi:conserved hypothetical protein [Histoplasma capsulatum var. duboisii H88]|uniref:Uncharacterized protein n=1 Tax=Ajellomyces capsulatus (strain H88) TaxID=544711 RepID=F0UV40_AJEC8|nr:conserved hypothetical protein [Histoplasma capsulatum var. duboisii H88]